MSLIQDEIATAFGVLFMVAGVYGFYYFTSVKPDKDAGKEAAKEILITERATAIQDVDTLDLSEYIANGIDTKTASRDSVNATRAMNKWMSYRCNRYPTKPKPNKYHSVVEGVYRFDATKAKRNSGEFNQMCQDYRDAITRLEIARRVNRTK